MKKFKFTLYGAWIGVRNAILGSVLFGVLATPLILLYFSITQSENAFAGLDFRFLTAGIGMVIFYCIAFSILPRIIGGAYLARWLESSVRVTTETNKRGLFVGALAGFIASAFYFIGWLVIDFYSAIGLELLALLIAAWMGLLGARILAREKEKFIEHAQT